MEKKSPMPNMNERDLLYGFYVCICVCVCLCVAVHNYLVFKLSAHFKMIIICFESEYKEPIKFNLMHITTGKHHMHRKMKLNTTRKKNNCTAQSYRSSI